MPNGTFTREVSVTFLKLTNMPCAVSGRRNARLASSLIAPGHVSNIRLDSGGSVRVRSCAHFGQDNVLRLDGSAFHSDITAVALDEYSPPPCFFDNLSAVFSESSTAAAVLSASVQYEANGSDL